MLEHWIYAKNFSGNLAKKKNQNSTNFQEKNTWAWTRLFLAVGSPSWVTCCESDAPQTSLIWTPWELTWAFSSVFCELCDFDEPGHPCTSSSVLRFSKHLSLAMCISFLYLSTACMSSLMLWRSVWIYKRLKRPRNHKIRSTKLKQKLNCQV